MPAKPSPDLLTQLREQTAVEHRRLEQHALLRPLAANDLNLDQYADVIAAFTGYYATLEPLLKPRLQLVEHGSYRYQPRLPLLASDLEYLPPRTIASCARIPLAQNHDQLTGILYVLEGASQGGRVIAPRLVRSLALRDGAGASYFHYYRQQSWQRFRELVRSGQHGYDIQSVLESAKDTFNSLYSHLDSLRLRLPV